MERVGAKRKSRGQRVLEGCLDGSRGAQPAPSDPLRHLPALGCTSPDTPDKHPKKQRVARPPGRDEKENEAHPGLGNDVAPSIADRPVGLMNGGNDCYIASSLQALMTPAFVKKLTKLGEDVQFIAALPKAGVVHTLLGVAERMDAARARSGGDGVMDIKDVHALIQARFPSLRGNGQQDAAEFYTLLLEGVMEEVVSAESLGRPDGEVPLSESSCPASQTFQLGFLCQRAGMCKNVFQEHNARWFMEFAVSEKAVDVVSELAKLFQEEEEISNFCDTCGSSHKFKETLEMNRVPEFFVVHANRNQDTQKCQVPLAVPEKLVVENGRVTVQSDVGAQGDKAHMCTQESHTNPAQRECTPPRADSPKEEQPERVAAKEQVTPPQQRASSDLENEGAGSGHRRVGSACGALAGGDADEFSTPVARARQRSEENSTPVAQRRQASEEFVTPVAQTRQMKSKEYCTPVQQIKPHVYESPPREHETMFGMPQSLLEEEEQLQRAMQESLRASIGDVQSLEDEEDEMLQRALRESLAESQQLETLSQDAENKQSNNEAVKKEPEPVTFKAKGKLIDDTIAEEPVGSTYNLVGYITHHGNTVLSGHYTARVKTSSGKWWWCNDESVVEEDADEALKNAQDGSLFFYERNDPAIIHID